MPAGVREDVNVTRQERRGVALSLAIARHWLPNARSLSMGEQLAERSRVFVESGELEVTAVRCSARVVHRDRQRLARGRELETVCNRHVPTL